MQLTYLVHALFLVLEGFVWVVLVVTLVIELLQSILSKHALPVHAVGVLLSHFGRLSSFPDSVGRPNSRACLASLVNSREHVLLLSAKDVSSQFVGVK